MSTGTRISGKGFILFAISLSLMLPEPAMAAPPTTGKSSVSSYRGIGKSRRVSYSSKNATKPKSRGSNPFSSLSARLKKVFKRDDQKTNEPQKLPMIAGMSPTDSSTKAPAKTRSPKVPSVARAAKQTKKVPASQQLEELYSKNGVELPEDFRSIAAPAPAPVAKSKTESTSNFKMKQSTTRMRASAFSDEPIVVEQSLIPAKRKSAPAKRKVSAPAPRKLEIADSKPAALKPVEVQPEKTESKEPAGVDPAFAAAVQADVDVVKEKIAKTTTETITTVETTIKEQVVAAKESAAKFPTDVSKEVVSALDAGKKKHEKTVSAVSMHQAYLKPTPAVSEQPAGFTPAYTETIVEKNGSSEFSMPVTQVSNSTTSKPPKKLTPNQRKMQRIAERAGQIGFKGFCPVVLRDERELADSNESYQWSYNGRTYDFSSEDAVETFKKAPHVYAPAFRGSDIVMIREFQLDQQGQLDYSTWYQGRLFMFSTAENMKKFRADPKSFVKKK